MDEPPDRSTDAVPAAPMWRRLMRWMRRLGRWCWRAALRTLQFLLILWATLAIYYSNLPWWWGRLALAIVFAAFAVWALWGTRRRRMGLAFAAAFAAVVAWFVSIPPAQNRHWRPEVAVLPRAIIDPDGDHVRLTGFRHFTYRSADDFDVHYDVRDIRISHVSGGDLFISYWMPGPVAHTFVSFDFDDGSLPVCVSIECRTVIGDGFRPVASNFKQFELIYVVGDERDIVRLRTDFRHEQVFCYHIRMTPDEMRRLFRIYLDRVNELADRPEWYNLLSNNCTLNIIRYARRARSMGRGRFSHRHLLNGFIDRYVYGAGVVDTSLPFDELRRRSQIDAAAHAADDSEKFSALIRAALPVPAPN